MVGTRNRKVSVTNSSDDEGDTNNKSINVIIQETVSQIIAEETSKLVGIIEDLKQEVLMLKESNIQLIHLLTNNANSDARYPIFEDSPNDNYQPVQNRKGTQKQTSSKAKSKAIGSQGQQKLVSIANSQKTAPLNQAAKKAINLTNCSSTKNPDIREVIDFKQKKNTNKKKITGTAEPHNTKFAAVPVTRRVWIHVSNFHKDLTADDMLEFLGAKFGIRDFVCHKIISKHPSPTFSSFKIGAESSMKDELLNPDTWCKGITVAEFDFFRARRNKIQFQSKRDSAAVSCDQVTIP